MRIELRPGDHEEFERWARARSTPQWRMERAQFVVSSIEGLSGRGLAEKVGISMPAVRRWLGLPGLKDRPRRVRCRERASARKSRWDRAVDAGGAARHGDAVRGAGCRHRTGDVASVCRISATKSSSRSCAPSKRTGPEFYMHVILDDYPAPTDAKVKPWLAKHPEITSTSCRPRPRGSTSSSAATDSTCPATQPHRLGDLGHPPTVPLPHWAPMAPLSRIEEG